MNVDRSRFVYPKVRFAGAPKSYGTVSRFGRVRLSRHFYMRNFMYSEAGAVEGILNMPEDPNRAIRNGCILAQMILEPLVETFGPIEVRSAYRSPTVNARCNDRDWGCGSNEGNYAGHIWDRADASGNEGANVSLVIPWFARRYDEGRDWRDLAWWLHDHIEYGAICFFLRKNISTGAAFNIGWRDNPGRSIYAYPSGGLLKAGADPAEDAATRAARYADFPPFRGIRYPE